MADDDAAQLRRWLWVQRSQLLAAAACGVLALAVIQAVDPGMGSGLALVVVVAAVAAGGVTGNTVAGIIVGHSKRPVRRPRSIASFVLILGVAGVLGLFVYLLVARLGLHPHYPVATFVAVSPLLALFASELVDGVSARSRD